MGDKDTSTAKQAAALEQMVEAAKAAVERAIREASGNCSVTVEYGLYERENWRQGYVERKHNGAVRVTIQPTVMQWGGGWRNIGFMGL